MGHSFVVIVVTVSTLLALEGVGRLYIRYRELKRPSGIFGEKILSHQEPLLGFGLKKNLKQEMGGWRVETNTLGFRDREFPIHKTKNEKRIFIVGGSTVFGWGVDREYSIPGFIEKSLPAEAQASLRIINAGVPWYASWHEAALIFFRILALEPDAIIVMDGLNDVAQGISPQWGPVSLGFLDPPTRLAFQRLNSDPSQRSFFVDLLGFSQTYTYFSAKLRAANDMSRGVYHPKLWEQYIRLKEQLTSVTQGQGLRFGTFLQPVLVFDKTLTPEETARNESNLRIPEFAATFRSAYGEGEKMLLGAPQLRVSSLRDAFKTTQETIYIDGQHYNALGNKILANLIYEKEIAPYLENGTKLAVNPIKKAQFPLKRRNWAPSN